jgi:hypothetical protein
MSFAVGITAIVLFAVLFGRVALRRMRMPDDPDTSRTSEVEPRLADPELEVTDAPPAHGREEVAASSDTRASEPHRTEEDPPPFESQYRVECRVLGTDSIVLEGASVQLGLEGAGPLEESTDRRGRVLFATSHKPVSVLARHVGKSAYVRPLSDVEHGELATRAETRIEIVLRPAGRLAVTVLDDLGARRERHHVTAHLIEAFDDGPRVGVLADVSGTTDEHGELALEHLEPGRWELFSPRWKDCLASERRTVELEPGRGAEGEILVQVLPRDGYASGTIDLPSDTHFDEGKVRGWALRMAGGRSLLHLYEPDRFYVFGRPGTVHRLELVDSSTGEPVGAPFEVRIGVHGIAIEAREDRGDDDR